MSQAPRARRGGTKYRGVSWHRASGRWRAYIRVDGRQRSLGYFETETYAGLAHDREAKKLYGEHARLNFGATSFGQPVPTE